MDMSDNNVPNEDFPLDSWCQTEVKHRFVWKIENFREKYSNLDVGKKQFICSSTFTIQGPGNEETYWRLSILKTTKNPEDDHLLISAFGKIDVEVTAGVQVSILNSSNNTKTEALRFNLIQTPVKVERIKVQTFGGKLKYSCLTSPSLQLLLNGNLTLDCNVTISGRRKPFLVQDDVVGSDKIRNSSSKDISMNVGHLHQDLGTAFINKEFSDVQLKCGERIFDCHQVILSARSPVFRAMFQADMLEKNTKKVDLHDLDPDVVEEMLLFIYTGKTPKLEGLAEDLLRAADRFQIEKLRTACEESLCSRLKVDNCVDLFVMGYLYHAENLKKESLKFISRNRGSISKSKDWKETLKNYPALTLEMTEELMKESKP